MEKFYNKTFRVVAILVMLSTAQLGVSYSNAESGENLELMETQKERLGVILTEKVVNGKLEVRQFALPEDTTERDMNRILSLEGTSGWSYVNYKEYHSGIVLFGKVSKDGEKFWRISINGSMNLTKGESDLQSRGNLNNSSPKMDKNFSSEDLNYRVIFSGKMIESDKENIFAIASMNTSQCPETSQNIQLLQFGNPTSDSVNSIDCNQKVRNSVLAR